MTDTEDTLDATGGDAAAQAADGRRVLLRLPVHFAKPSHTLVLRRGPKPARKRGRVPRVARLLALAHHFQDLLDRGVVVNQSELAEVAGMTRARVTQILNLRYLAPDIQEEILFLPRVTAGRAPISEPALRRVLQSVSWNEQRRRWQALRCKCHCDAGAPASAPAQGSAGFEA